MRFKPQVLSLEERANPDATIPAGLTQNSFANTSEHVATLQNLLTTQLVSISSGGQQAPSLPNHPYSYLTPPPTEVILDWINRLQEINDRLTQIQCELTQIESEIDQLEQELDNLATQITNAANDPVLLAQLDQQRLQIEAQITNLNNQYVSLIVEARNLTQEGRMLYSFVSYFGGGAVVWWFDVRNPVMPQYRTSLLIEYEA